MFGIYIHVPFCLRKCDYCDFFSVPVAADAVPHMEYLSALRRQLDRDAKAFGLDDRLVGSVYFGGGTPSLMPPVFFAHVLSDIHRYFNIDADAEVSCEVNPATADLAWFRAARDAGITRISIGAQSFNDRLLKALGRIHSADDAMRAIASAQGAGFKSVGVDLMYAIPGEEMSDLEEDLRTAMTFQPEHISAYQLTVEEGTALYERRATSDERLPSEDDQLMQMRTVARLIERMGWKRYEISNYAKPGFGCRHNLNHWRYGEYLGLGAGATAFVRTYERTSFARRWTQIRDVASYIVGSGDLAESEDLDLRTAMAEFCFMGLRKMDGISIKDFERIFEVAFGPVYGAELNKLIKEKLLDVDGDRISLTRRGIELSNQVFERFVTL